MFVQTIKLLKNQSTAQNIFNTAVAIHVFFNYLFVSYFPGYGKNTTFYKPVDHSCLHAFG